MLQEKFFHTFIHQFHFLVLLRKFKLKICSNSLILTHSFKGAVNYCPLVPSTGKLEIRHQTQALTEGPPEKVEGFFRLPMQVDVVPQQLDEDVLTILSQ